jgi:hypothetical protein
MDAYHERKGTSSSAKSSSPLEKSHISDGPDKKVSSVIQEEEDSGDEDSSLIKKNQ